MRLQKNPLSSEGKVGFTKVKVNNSMPKQKIEVSRKWLMEVVMIVEKMVLEKDPIKREKQLNQLLGYIHAAQMFLEDKEEK